MTRHAPLSRTPACLALIMAAEKLGLLSQPRKPKRPAASPRQMELPR